MKYITAFLLLIAVHANAEIQTLDWSISDDCSMAMSNWVTLSNNVRVRATAQLSDNKTLLAGILLEAPGNNIWTAAYKSVQNINKQNINMWENILADKRYKMVWPESVEGNVYLFEQLAKTSVLRIMNQDGSYVHISARGAVASIRQLGNCKPL